MAGCGWPDPSPCPSLPSHVQAPLPRWWQRWLWWLLDDSGLEASVYAHGLHGAGFHDVVQRHIRSRQGRARALLGGMPAPRRGSWTCRKEALGWVRGIPGSTRSEGPCRVPVASTVPSPRLPKALEMGLPFTHSCLSASRRRGFPSGMHTPLPSTHPVTLRAGRPHRPETKVLERKWHKQLGHSWESPALGCT